jgi:hypothetical protein
MMNIFHRLCFLTQDFKMPCNDRYFIKEGCGKAKDETFGAAKHD